MAILMVSSLILSPRQETGGTFIHALDSTDPAASSLALDSTSLHDVRMVSNRTSILGLSEDKKAVGARWEALRMPRPPHDTRRVA